MRALLEGPAAIHPAAINAAQPSVSLYIGKAPARADHISAPEAFHFRGCPYLAGAAFGISTFETVMASPFISPVSATLCPPCAFRSAKS